MSNLEDCVDIIRCCTVSRAWKAAVSEVRPRCIVILDDMQVHMEPDIVFETFNGCNSDRRHTSLTKLAMMLCSRQYDIWSCILVLHISESLLSQVACCMLQSILQPIKESRRGKLNKTTAIAFHYQHCDLVRQLQLALGERQWLQTLHNCC